jgi:phosphoenolpyruvate synthase/pyruvate phosphate dikinase
MKDEKWFHWERQATILPIMMCMEAWIGPMEEKYGRPWPTSTLIFNCEIVSWYNLWGELLDYGQYLIGRLLQEGKMEELGNEISSQASRLDKMFSKFDSLSFEDSTDEELLARYSELHRAYTDWFVIGGLVEPVGYAGERMVRKLLTNLPEEEREEAFSLLTTTTRESFSRREAIEMLGIAAEKSEGNEVSSMLAEHAEKYHWLHNNYFSTEELGVGFFESELEKVLLEFPDPKAQIGKMGEDSASIKEKKQALLARLGLDEQGRALVELLDMFAWYQDFRKEYIMRMLRYLDLIVGEMGRRRGLKLEDVKCLLPGEIPALLKAPPDCELVEERKKRFLFHFDSQGVEPLNGTGKWSYDMEEKLLGSSTHEKDIVELRGLIANKGHAKGRARVTMSAQDAKAIEEGEILVTSMTTPDFVVAIKRAGAIVTNEGGILSHAAVISREFGIPCIVGTRMATRVFKTGDLLEIDCELGVVRKVPK